MRGLVAGGILSVLVALMMSMVMGELALYLLAAAVPGLVVGGIWHLLEELGDLKGQLGELRKELETLQKKDKEE